MAIQYFPGGIMRDTNICDTCDTYLTNGQGCDTVWFKDVMSARKAKEKDGIKTGRDLVDCTKCACHYSVHSKEWKKYPGHLCSNKKEAYAKSFE